MGKNWINLTFIVVAAALFFAPLISDPAILKSATCNPIVYRDPVATINEPAQSGSYVAQNLVLNVTVRLNGYTYSSIEQVRSLYYTLDENVAGNLEVTYPRQYAPGYDVTTISELTNLTDGQHNVTVIGETTFGKPFNATVTFNVAAATATPNQTPSHSTASASTDDTATPLVTSAPTSKPTTPTPTAAPSDQQTTLETPQPSTVAGVEKSNPEELRLFGAVVILFLGVAEIILGGLFYFKRRNILE